MEPTRYRSDRGIGQAREQVMRPAADPGRAGKIYTSLSHDVPNPDDTAPVCNTKPQ
jgi:hypothetical protein